MTATSAAVKSVEALLRTNVMFAVLPAVSEETLDWIEIVGATVSIVIDGAREPAVLGLPAASVKAAAATETVPTPVELAVGVNVAE